LLTWENTDYHNCQANMGPTSPPVVSDSYAAWNPFYATQPLSKMACSDGANGLITRWGYKDLEQMFPYVTAISGISWNSPKCGLCYKLTDVKSKNSISVTIVDSVGDPPGGYDMRFNLGHEAFKMLLGDAGEHDGHGSVTWEETDYHNCQGNKGPKNPVVLPEVLPAYAAPLVSYASWNPFYATQPLSKTACSDGANGLITRWGYKDLEQMFPYVTAISGLSWNSPKCGLCYKLTDVQSKKTISVTVIDSVPPPPGGYDMHFNLGHEAFKMLLGDAGEHDGHGSVTWEETDYHNCQGNKGPTSEIMV